MTRTEHADVLVLGAGLSGLRAAVSALDQNPKLAVTVAATGRGPAGSSFANMNDALGIQVPESGAEQEDFIREAMRIAPPGHVDGNLVRIMAEEARARYRDLLDLGLSPVQATGEERKKGCFSKGQRAYIFNGLSSIYSAFHARFVAQGGRLLHGGEVRKILLSASRAVGAQISSKTTGETTLVRAGAVVLCLGGPAPLFAQDMSGPGNTGYGLGLLSEAGARLDNAGFIQFMWLWSGPDVDSGPGRFISPSVMVKKGMTVHKPGGGAIRIPLDLPEENSMRLDRLRRSRGGHCPAGYGLEDSVLDLLLLDNVGPDGSVRVSGPKGDFRGRLMAHAGNGGAVINEQGRTSLPGLLACGECATGMHGANRLGGAMILATQVFGHRAGKAAAEISAACGLVGEKTLRELCPDQRPTVNNHDHQEEISWIKKGMQEYAIFGGRPGLSEFQAGLKECRSRTQDRQTELTALSALAITSHLTAMRK